MWRNLFLALAMLLPAVADAGPRHVVLVVWDGMRPDFITEKNTPTLYALAERGVRFKANEAVYLTATDVNGTAIATGDLPQRSGLFANLQYLPAIDPIHPVDTGAVETIRRGDETSGGKYLAVPTFVELLRKAGKSVALVGSKSVAVLFDRGNDWTVAEVNDRPLAIFVAAPLPPTRRKELTDLLGGFFDKPGDSALERNNYSTRALTEFFWRESIPDFSLLWLSQPDWSQHNFSPGSPEAIAAIHAVDENLKQVIDTLKQHDALDSTAIFVVSDHGFSTIRRSIDLIASLNAAGIHAVKAFSATPARGDLLVCGNGGSVVCYAYEHDEATIDRLIEFLQKSDYVDSIFTRDGRHETKHLSEVAIDVPVAPDLVLSFKATDDKNKFGVPGMIDADWNRPAGDGTHASLSPWDRHNTLVAAGAGLRQSFDDTTPSRNIDLAPTILHLLGVTGGDFQGRELREAYADAAKK